MLPSIAQECGADCARAGAGHYISLLASRRVSVDRIAMKVLIQYEYRASKKEPFGVLLRRLHDGLVEAGLRVSYEFAFADSPVGGGVSAVDRSVKKFAQLAALVQTVALPGILGSGQKVIRGGDADLPFATLAELADGLPRSLPFHSARVRFGGPAFGVGPPLAMSGIDACDSWWVNGRQRSLIANFVLEVAESQRGLPAPEGALAAFFAKLGKPSKTNRIPMLAQAATADEPAPARAALTEITQKYRARLGELLAEAGMPHSLPPRIDALQMGIYSQHPLKPTLERHFKPLGFSCNGGSGTFSLRRRTAANHVVEIDMDVGTWSRMVLAQFRVHVPGVCCALPMPVATGVDGGQYPIGDAERWEKIVANLAALAAHLDRQIVPEIDAAAGPAPEWFDAPR